MLGEATGRGVAFVSRVGRTGIGNGVDVGMVSATVSVGCDFGGGSPPTVTTRYGAPPSLDRTRVPAPAMLSFRMPHPVATSSAAPAIRPNQPARRRRERRCMFPPSCQHGCADSARSRRLDRPYSFQRRDRASEDNIVSAGGPFSHRRATSNDARGLAVALVKQSCCGRWSGRLRDRRRQGRLVPVGPTR
jgi:hypothetical protein